MGREVLGNPLASAGMDGQVLLWRPESAGRWEMATVLGHVDEEVRVGGAIQPW